MRIVPLVLFVLLMLAIGETEIHAKKQEPEIEMLQWERVDEVLPRYSKFTVKDMDSGKKFRVQRRAGSRHADVQPLTTKDTEIMKRIYNGKWSWKRRAVIVSIKGHRIAASMHGMPHGAGALKNNFPGHFCIHFYGSTTHRTNFMDLSHKLMILKAAGELERYLAKADPYELTNAYIAGMKQHDVKVVSETSLQEIKWEKVFSRVENVNVDKMAILPAEDLSQELFLSVPVTLSLQLHKSGSSRYEGTIKLVRFSPEDRWKVDSAHLLKEIDLEYE